MERSNADIQLRFSKPEVRLEGFTQGIYSVIDIHCLKYFIFKRS